MWKVENVKNSIELGVFHEKVIKPIFILLIEMSKCNKVKNFTDRVDIENCINNTSNGIIRNSSLLLYIVSFKYKKVFISDMLIQLINSKPYNEIIKLYKLYYLQKRALDKLDYNLTETAYPEEIKFLFSVFFYERLFHDKKLWGLLGFAQYNKEQFNKNFKSENKLQVCPYCDMDTLNNKGNCYIEHFLPKSKFPLLVMHSNNMASSCNACNLPAYGKGVKIKNPIVSLYNAQIGEQVEFSVDYTKSNIEIKSSIIEISNYIELLQLDKRYAEDNIFNAMIGEANIFYDSVARFTSDKILIKAILIDDNRKISRSRPLNFLLLSVFEDISEYEVFRALTN